MKKLAICSLWLAAAMLILGSTTFADIPAPDSPSGVSSDNTVNIFLGLGFAIAGAVLFTWLGRRSAKG